MPVDPVPVDPVPVDPVPVDPVPVVVVEVPPLPPAPQPATIAKEQRETDAIHKPRGMRERRGQNTERDCKGNLGGGSGGDISVDPGADESFARRRQRLRGAVKMSTPWCYAVQRSVRPAGRVTGPGHDWSPYDCHRQNVGWR